VVPGEGKEAGKPLPEGAMPKPGKGEGRGEEASGEDTSKPGFQEGYKPSGRPGLSAREKLFDRGVIGDAARKGPAGQGVGKKDDEITFDTSEYRYAGYMRKLKAKIESIWEYPAEARARRLYGDLRIRFTIKKDGRLGAIELLRTSGYKALDDAAIKALRDGEPYWPLPDEWGIDSYTISGHFIYTMYGYGIQ
jgi:protein TonB